MRIRYRVLQFWQGLTANIALRDTVDIDMVLTPPLRDLFFSLQPVDQVHGLKVYRELLAQGETNQDLLAASLLHDIGKNRFPLQSWQRVMIVVGNRIFPKKVKQWSQGNPESWRRPFVVSERHATWGAQIAMNAGATPTTVKLIEHHHDQLKHAPGEPDDLLLSRLQLIDNRT